MPLPFDAAISDYFENSAPSAVRAEITAATKGKILSCSYPYEKRMARAKYEEQMADLQIELVKFQAWVKSTGKRIAVIFEGRDAAGKGGTIKRFRANLNPRIARIVALPKPSDREMREWYFQRYISNLPLEGEITFFDRSWYNRGVVEKVFDFCTEKQRDTWFKQVQPFEDLLVQDGISLTKIWLNVGQSTQLKRFMDREKDPLKQWKLSWIDVEGLNRWDTYSDAIAETLAKTSADNAPWTVIRADDKRRARLDAIRAVLLHHEYDGRDDAALGQIDPLITGGLDFLHE